MSVYKQLHSCMAVSQNCIQCLASKVHFYLLNLCHSCAAGAARDTHLAWNWLELQQILLESPCMRLVLSGHDHIGGYAQHGHIHFVTLEAMLEGMASLHLGRNAQLQSLLCNNL